MQLVTRTTYNNAGNLLSRKINVDMKLDIRILKIFNRLPLFDCML